MEHPTLHLSISKDGNLILSKQLNNQLESVMEIPTQNVHYLHVSNKYMENPKIFIGKLAGKESLKFQVSLEQHQQWQKTIPNDIFKLFTIQSINLPIKNNENISNNGDMKVNNDNNLQYTLTNDVDCLIDLSLKQYESLPPKCYENFICIRNIIDGYYFDYTYINLDYVVDIDIGFNYRYQPYNFLFRFKKNNAEFQYISSLLSNLNRYVVQFSLDDIQLSAGEVDNLLNVINKQLSTSLHIQKSYQTIKNLSLIREKLDNLVKLEQQKLF